MAAMNSNMPAAPWPLSWLDGLTCACCTSCDAEEKQDAQSVLVSAVQVQFEEEMGERTFLDDLEETDRTIAQHSASSNVPPTLLQGGVPAVAEKRQGSYKRSPSVEKFLKLYPNAKQVNVPGEQVKVSDA